MKKGKVYYKLKNEDLVTEYEGNCLFHEDKNILIYKEQNDMEVMLELDRLLLTRENKEMFLMLDFYGGESYVVIKELDKKTPMNVTVYKKELTKNSFSISYSLSSDSIFDFNVEWVLEDE
jgi:hypothetical protein